MAGTVSTRSGGLFQLDLTAHNFLKFLEKHFREFFRCAGDQTTAQLCKLTTCFSLGNIAKNGVFTVLDKFHIGTALGKTGNAAIAFASETERIRRLAPVEGDTSAEASLDRTDLERDLGHELGIGFLVQFLTSRDTCLQDFDIVQRVIDLRTRRRDGDFVS